MDDGGGARLLHGFAAGVGVQAGGVGSAAAPHAAVLGLGRVAAAAVGAAHGAVVQGHCGRRRVQMDEQADDSHITCTVGILQYLAGHSLRPWLELTVQIRRAVHMEGVPPLHVHHGVVLLHRS